MDFDVSRREGAIIAQIWQNMLAWSCRPGTTIHHRLTTSVEMSVELQNVPSPNPPSTMKAIGDIFHPLSQLDYSSTGSFIFVRRHPWTHSAIEWSFIRRWRIQAINQHAMRSLLLLDLPLDHHHHLVSPLLSLLFVVPRAWGLSRILRLSGFEIKLTKYHIRYFINIQPKP